ncbi:exodeoxyribonuclease III [Magnetospirillum sp. UT-4]|uniref:exodeoxyribonuclease III n=1 Tax=Magnetospirillum sp. UT-4 TaxID=2681467 RepID=UPI0013861F97|nr:exodeoxyribonuclease III [Magnetospirillum sp. UT-4]CAA7623708.1 Exodeoxyribonuclease III [Magnetospirillum sp. UT-4]
MVRIASWNVNSVKARLPNVVEWLDSAKPDVVLLQEIKCQDEGFPFLEIEAAGYRAAVHGQKSYNGVAILSRLPMDDIRRGLPGDEADPQARWIEATIAGLRIASLYLPNGNPAPGEKYDYKLAWMRRLVAHARTLLAGERPLVLGGDYNVCPTDADVYDPPNWRDDALCRPQSRALFRELLHQGFTEAFRVLHSEPGRYTFWDYQAGAWPRDEGLRIDHLLLSPQAADRLVACDIDKAPRGRERASDHTPIWVELS